MDSFGKRLRALRQEKKLTQAELGKILRVTNVGVAKWESDDRFPDKHLLVQIADLFDCSIDYLLCRTDNRQGIISEANINGHHYAFELDRKVFPNGFTYEQMVQALKELEERNKKLEKEAKLARKLKKLVSDDNTEE